MKVKIKLNGCDGTTHWMMDVTGPEYTFLKWMETKSKKLSPYSCYPILVVLEQCEHCSSYHNDFYTDGDCVDKEEGWSYSIEEEGIE